jgi:hypothetical protein
MGKAKAGAKPPRKGRTDTPAEAVPGFLLTPSRRRRLEEKKPAEGLARLALSRTRGAEPTD